SVEGICEGGSELVSDSILVTILPSAEPPIVENVQIEEPNNVTLYALGDNLMWYSDEISDDPIGQGEMLDVGFISEGTWWVESNTIFGGEQEGGGKVTNSGGGGVPSNDITGTYNLFDVWEPFTLKTVKVYAPSGSGQGIRTVQLFDGQGLMIQESNFELPEGEHIIELNWFIPIGQGFSLRCPQNSLFRNDGGVSYPYPIGSVGAIYNSVYGPEYYYFFYDWQIQKEAILCPSERVSINVSLCEYDPCGNCGGTSIAGCTNPNACNYNPDAACDNNSCTFPGCTDPETVNYDPLEGCDDGSCIPTFGSFGLNAPASMLYSDTLEIEVVVNNGQNIYGLFASLEYDTEHFEFVGSTLGDYLGDQVLASPPVDAAGSIEFGASKLGQQAGSNGDGLFYTLQFVPISSVLGAPILVDFSLSASDAFNANGISGELFLPETQSVELIFEAEVWPGDLNHDGVVSVADILPIGYFYDITGPERPNASLAWQGQNCPIWGTGSGFPGDGFYRVFADGNGDGVVNLADQVAVGFNIDQIVSLNIAPSNLEMLAFAQNSNVLVPISNEVTPSQINIPGTESITVQFFATTNAIDVETLFGFTMNIDLSPLGILASDAEIDFTSSEFGVLNESLIAQTYAQGNQLDLAITRTTPNNIVGEILLFEMTLPIESNLSADSYTLPVNIGSANDPTGQIAVLNAQDIQLSVSSSLGCIDANACNFNPDATIDDGSCITIGASCDDNNGETINDVINSDCVCAGELIVEIVLGCTDLNACNYDINANQDDGSCFSIGELCDDNDPTTENDIIQDNCLCEGEEILVIFGCTDPEACNFNEEANVDDESCTYVVTYEITGTNIPQAFSTQNYSYTNTSGSTYQWTITGGVIVSGQGSASIEVVWSSEGGGSIVVVETNEDGCVGEEVNFEVVILPTTVDEINSSELLFYPNPASEFIYFEAASELIGALYYVYDLQGKIIAQGTLNEGVNQLNISKFSSGNYEVIILAENRALKTRFVVE
ncbi:MAG: T9SS type A sorting domain-containing protein, partial [Flavobacteriales bacterium]|nr:T9SS type A sorting domain-containing protein [Flavobacteriales bacterium]